MRAHFGSPVRTMMTRLLCLVLTLGVATPVWAGGEKCSSSQTADELIECDHCYALKSLLNTEPKVDVEISVYDLARGVLIDFSAADEAAMDFVREVVAELWGMESTETASTRVANYCNFCQTRNKQLQALERDRAYTNHGAVVILTSDDAELVKWSRQDAHWVEGVLQRAVSSH